MSYSKFKQYAQKFSKDYWGDYVHNIWIRYWDKHGRDLFKEGKTNRWIFKAVKNEFVNSLYNSWRIQDIHGEQHELNEQPELLDIGEVVIDDDPNIFDIMVARDLDQFIKNKIKKYTSHSSFYTIDQVLTIYECMKMGYSGADIAKYTGINENQVSIFKKQIKESITMGIASANPFNGSRVKVTRVVSLKVWEGYDQGDYEDEDENEFYILKVHKESLEGLLIRLPEEKRNSYIIRQHDFEMSSKTKEGL